MEPSAKKSTSFSRVIRLTLGTVAFFYVGLCLLVFFYQRHLLYYPVVRTAEEVNRLALAANMERWTNAAGQFIGLKRLVTNQPTMGTVFMLYGNGSSAVRCSVYADVIQQTAPLDFYVLEYPGYEDRGGTPSRTSLLNTATNAFQRLDTAKPVYLVGESLGTGVASYLAGEFPDKITGVMLLSPYNRLADIAQNHYPLLPARWIMLDDFWSEHYLKKFHGLVGVMIDGKDSVVPAQFGHRLYDGYTGPKRLWAYPNCNHVELGESPATFWKAVIEFWQTTTTNAAAVATANTKI
ncbi:MAG TPA: alpha/beta hydrolase [Verrucomicrobiae bacterium]|nr:alpha/beta hydrolase [Verrucomicrobiae bacterium]